MKKVKIIIGLILIFSTIFVCYYLKNNYEFRGYVNNNIYTFQGKTLNNNFNTKIKSGNLSTDYDINTALVDRRKFDLNTLNIPVTINIDNLSSSDMSIDKASENKAIKMMKKLRDKKVNVILEPYPWIKNGSKTETEWNPEDKEKFFNNWETKVLKPLIDDIAIPYHVDALNVGTSFNYMDDDEKNMCSIIDYVKKYYKGLVTYRTSWWYTADFDPKYQVQYEKKLNNKLFSKLDFISIAAYFELTGDDINQDTYSVENLTKALESSQIYNRKQNIKQQIKNFYDVWKKPIFFGELGFPRTDLASFQPWNPYASNKMNNTAQANCFEAYRRTFENEPWQLGFSVFAIGEHSKDKFYYPSDESRNIIKRWYNKEIK